MRHPELDYMMLMERRNDELREAEQHRLLKLARGERLARPSYFRIFALALSTALNYLGEHMLEWSARLQCRYRLLAATPENQPEPCA